MRASTSCPRSSVPRGCAHDGPLSLALKSISSMGTRYTSGPTSTATTMNTRIPAPMTASRWRRKRRHASAVSEVDGRRMGAAGAPVSAPARLSVRDAGIEPAIEEIRDQAEDHHQRREDEGDGHDHRGVVGENRADEEGADAGHAEDLLGDEGAREDRGHLQRDQRDHGDEGVADHVLHDRDTL